MLIRKYQKEQSNTWNEFIQNSKQGTFLLNRNYMDYHSDRFEDHSLMFYNEKDKLIAMLPANIKENILHSHQGLSYGGLIYGKNAKTTDILECFEVLKSYAKENNIEKLIYKRIPFIYHTYPADEDLYALFRNDAKLIRRDISFAVNTKNRIDWNELRKRSFKKSIKEKLVVKINEDYQEYHNILSEVLKKNHDAQPVHSIQEMEMLAQRFPENTKLVSSYKDSNMLSGLWLFIEQNTIHTQYIATSQDGKTCGAFEIIIDFLLKEFSDKQYISFGISTEQNGKSLNEGLAQQKESFGGRGICYDFYEICF